MYLSMVVGLILLITTPDMWGLRLPPPPTIETPTLKLYAQCRSDSSVIPYWIVSEQHGKKLLTQQLQCQEA